MNGSKSEKSFFVGKLTVLAHSIKTADELDFLSLVGLDINTVPFLMVRFENLTVSLSLFLQFSLLSFVFDLLLALNTELLIDSKLVCNTSIKSCLEKASLVL